MSTEYKPNKILTDINQTIEIAATEPAEHCKVRSIII